MSGHRNVDPAGVAAPADRLSSSRSPLRRLSGPRPPLHVFVDAPIVLLHPKRLQLGFRLVSFGFHFLAKFLELLLLRGFGLLSLADQIVVHAAKDVRPLGEHWCRESEECGYCDCGFHNGLSRFNFHHSPLAMRLSQKSESG